MWPDGSAETPLRTVQCAVETAEGGTTQGSRSFARTMGHAHGDDAGDDAGDDGQHSTVELLEFISRQPAWL